MRCAVAESPAELLERAAAQLEEAAAHFEGYVEARERHELRVGSPQQWWAYDTVDRNASAAAKRWVEMMGPPVATPLVNWLRDTADDLRDAPVQTSVENYALEFARQVLGEHAEEAPHG